jgi:hypothetical protein
LQLWGENPRQMRFCGGMLSSACTESCHMLVNELHSIDFKPDKPATFLLTPKTGRVKTQSFFDNF